MYEVSPECRKRKSVWPGRALASSRSLRGGGASSHSLYNEGPPRATSPVLHLASGW